MEKAETRFEKLKTLLLKQITGSPLNTRLPSEREMTVKYGVSRMTINKVLVELEKEGYVRRQIGRGTFVAPRDQTIHITENGQRSKGVVICAYPDFFSYHIWCFVHEMELAALKNNLTLVNVKIMQGTDQESLLEIIGSQSHLRGCVISPTAKLTKTFVRRLDALGVPVIFSSMIPQAFLNLPNIYEVRNHFFQSGYRKIHYLLEMGHRKIGYVSTEPDTLYDRETFLGMQNALEEFGMRLKELATLKENTMELWCKAVEFGYRNTHLLLKEHPDVTALCYQTVNGAFGGLRALAELNRNVPDDISIITSLDMDGMENYTNPPLTCLCPKVAKQAETAVSLILNEAKGLSKTFLIDHNLIIRQSVKKIIPKEVNTI